MEKVEIDGVIQHATAGGGMMLHLASFPQHLAGGDAVRVTVEKIEKIEPPKRWRWTAKGLGPVVVTATGFATREEADRHRALMAPSAVLVTIEQEP